MTELDHLYQQLRHIINEETATIGQPYTYGAFTGLGWLNFHYTCSTYDGPYPRMSLKQFDKAVHFYIMLWINGKPILDDYVTVFGKSAVGKGCLRFKKLTPEREMALREIIRAGLAADNLPT